MRTHKYTDGTTPRVGDHFILEWPYAKFVTFRGKGYGHGYIKKIEKGMIVTENDNCVPVCLCAPYTQSQKMRVIRD